jgi:hypothetical protein
MKNIKYVNKINIYPIINILLWTSKQAKDKASLDSLMSVDGRAYTPAWNR